MTPNFMQKIRKYQQTDKQTNEQTTGGHYIRPSRCGFNKKAQDFPNFGDPH